MLFIDILLSTVLVQTLAFKTLTTSPGRLHMSSKGKQIQNF
jgi:uncharacterized membrane-anchored protein